MRVRDMSRKQQKAVFANLGNPNSSTGSSDRDKVLEKEFGKPKQKTKKKKPLSLLLKIRRNLHKDLIKRSKEDIVKDKQDIRLMKKQIVHSKNVIENIDKKERGLI